jgi:chromosome segregation ATPase
MSTSNQGASLFELQIQLNNLNKQIREKAKELELARNLAPETIDQTPEIKANLTALEDQYQDLIKSRKVIKEAMAKLK